MTENPNKDDGSLMLNAIRAIAISPEKAKKMVDQYKHSAKKLNKQCNDNEIEKIVSKKIIAKYSRYASLSGGLSAVPGIVPGIGTVAAMVGGGTADATVCMKIQIDMTMLLAVNFGWDLTDHDAMYMTILIAVAGGLEQLGVQSGAPIASKAGVKMLQQYLKGATLEAVKQFFTRFGINFTRKAVEKSMPFGIGVVAGSSLNYGLTRYVGYEAVKCFTIERQMREDPDEEMEWA
ncbi:hypothetical protein JCM25156A_25750 [Komagataeibacter kakiaceti JCM 25156]|uniref:hypothetical protein n=1 Tax=Komagataeibacter kakiaceti TaxID=943261 RepID=UPI00046ED8F4|nr:hypothetical protein [Komagataeibacter kakiaceti]